LGDWMFRRIGVLLFGLALIAGWSASSASANLSSELGAGSPSPSVVVRNYVDGLVSDSNGATHGKAETFAAPGSLAAEYAKEQGAFSSALPIRVTSRKIRGGLSICDSQNNCAGFTALRARKGKLVTFTVSGKPLDQRLRVLAQSVTDGPLTFTGRWAYLSAASGKLAVVVDVRNDSASLVHLDGSSTVWIDPTGRQQMNSLAGIGEAQPDVNSHAVATMLLSFDGSGGQIGGRVIVKAYEDLPPANQPQAHYQGELSLG
jgi:hypothetical protein